MRKYEIHGNEVFYSSDEIARYSDDKDRKKRKDAMLFLKTFNDHLIEVYKYVNTPENRIAIDSSLFDSLLEKLEASGEMLGQGFFKELHKFTGNGREPFLETGVRFSLNEGTPDEEEYFITIAVPDTEENRSKIINWADKNTTIEQKKWNLSNGISKRD